MPSQNYAHPTWIEIDLKQFKKNIALIRSYIGSSLFCLPVKANAYGHGLTSMAKASEEAGVDYLAVAHLQEGVELRLAGIKIPILVLGAIHEDQIVDLIHFDLDFTISSKFKADLVAKECQSIKKKCRVHMEVDTGMQRTGVRCETAPSLFEHLKKLGCFEVVGVYSHFATADIPKHPFTKEQMQAFNQLFQHPLLAEAKLIRHIANSGGVAYLQNSHLDMVRPSLLTFGYLGEQVPAPLNEVAPCFSLKAKISYFKVVGAGKGISYGLSYTTARDTRIVTVPLGYGDGFRRALSNKGSVLIRGKKFPIVGTVCMDQFMVDVGQNEVYVGDEVVMIGKQANEELSLLEMARLCDTIPYEVLCLFNDRIPRIYLS